MNAENTKAIEPEIFGKNMHTRNDVEAILKVHGERISEGYIIPYPSIEGIIGEERHSQRWISVISQLKNRLFKNKNLYLKAEINEGYLVLNPSQRIKESSDIVNHGIRRIRKGGTVAAATEIETLTPEERKAREHIVLTNATISGHLNMLKKTEKMAIAE